MSKVREFFLGSQRRLGVDLTETAGTDIDLASGSFVIKDKQTAATVITGACLVSASNDVIYHYPIFTTGSFTADQVYVDYITATAVIGAATVVLTHSQAFGVRSK